MKKVIFLSPVNAGVGLYTVALGFVRSLEKRGLKACLLSPIAHEEERENKDLYECLNDYSTPLPISAVERLLSKREEDKILEFVLGYMNTHAQAADVVVITGIPQKNLQSYAVNLNSAIAAALSAEVILICSPGGKSLSFVSDHLEISADNFGGMKNKKILGCILNKVGAPTDRYGNTRIDLFDPPEDKALTFESFHNLKIKLLGFIPWKRSLMARHINGVVKHLNAEVLNTGSYKNHKILHFALAAATMDNVSKVFKPNVLIITSGDRNDIIIGACMAYLSGINIAGLLLTGGHIPSKETMTLCKNALDGGLPILLVKTDSLRTSIALQNIQTSMLEDDAIQTEEIKRYIAGKIDEDFIESLKEDFSEYTLSPAAFKYNLMKKATALKRTIILPEGNDPRILQAASFCSKKGIASIILLGNKKEIQKLCGDSGIQLDEQITIIDPKSPASTYVSRLVELRKHKGLTEKNAIDYLSDPIVVGMMMLEEGRAHGLVAGANTTTANVVSPALKILKTAKGAKLVSSLFFMCLPEEVVVYADCAVNQNPTAEGLADIAIQTANTAKAFSIDPKIAMISYSTGSSGTGADVEKVKEAVTIAKALDQDLEIDGPLQYDAASTPEIARKKAPESAVAGKANVFIFPDLNTANTTYKAVQRSAGALSIGPVLQGLKKPVNDLSRGATVGDIIYTITITAIQE